MDINRVTIIGRLTKDAELRYTGAGTPISTFSVAVNKKILREKEWVDEVYYFECSMFGKRAEGVSKYLLKGKQVGLDGELQQRRWSDKETGSPRSKVQIYVNFLQFLGKQEKDDVEDKMPDEPIDTFDSDGIPF